MPYLRVEIDAIKDAQGVAGAVGINLAQIVGGLNLMWAHCWQNKSDSTTTVQLAGHFCAPGIDLVPALMEFGFLEKLPDGSLRVRGAEKYLRISEAQSEAAKRTNELRRSARSSERSTVRSDDALTPIHRSTDLPIYRSTPGADAPGAEVDPAEVARGDVAALLQGLWNETIKPPLIRWDTISANRRKKAKARWSEKPSEGYWREVIRRLAANGWCQGENPSGWVASADFLLQPETHVKAMEGRYKPKLQAVPSALAGPKRITDEERARGIYEGQATK